MSAIPEWGGLRDLFSGKVIAQTGVDGPARAAYLKDQWSFLSEGFLGMIGFCLWDLVHATYWIYPLKRSNFLICPQRSSPYPSATCCWAHSCAYMCENNHVKRTWPHQGLRGRRKEIHMEGENCILLVTFYYKIITCHKFNCKHY